MLILLYCCESTPSGHAARSEMLPQAISLLVHLHSSLAVVIHQQNAVKFTANPQTTEEIEDLQCMFCKAMSTAVW